MADLRYALAYRISYVGVYLTGRLWDQMDKSIQGMVLFFAIFLCVPYSHPDPPQQPEKVEGVDYFLPNIDLNN